MTGCGEGCLPVATALAAEMGLAVGLVGMLGALAAAGDAALTGAEDAALPRTTPGWPSSRRRNSLPTSSPTRVSIMAWRLLLVVGYLRRITASSNSLVVMGRWARRTMSTSNLGNETNPGPLLALASLAAGAATVGFAGLAAGAGVLRTA